jgi:hypothetical protein
LNDRESLETDFNRMSLSESTGLYEFQTDRMGFEGETDTEDIISLKEAEAELAVAEERVQFLYTYIDGFDEYEARINKPKEEERAKKKKQRIERERRKEFADRLANPHKIYLF